MKTRLEQRDQRGFYKVEDVLDRRTARNTNGTTSWEYLIKWQDYPPENNTWEPWRNLNTYGKKFVFG